MEGDEVVVLSSEYRGAQNTVDVLADGSGMDLRLMIAIKLKMWWVTEMGGDRLGPRIK